MRNQEQSEQGDLFIVRIIINIRIQKWKEIERTTLLVKMRVVGKINFPTEKDSKDILALTLIEL